MGIHSDSVKNILEIKGVEILSNCEVNRKIYGKSVLQLTKNGKAIRAFTSLSDAGRYLGNVNKNRHISEVCNGKRKTAYGYKWKFI